MVTPADLTGIIHAPMKAETGGSPRRHHQGPGWIDDIRLDCISSFAEIAEREAQGERHIRLLAPLAFLSPHIFAAIVNGTAPADLTVTGLASLILLRILSLRFQR